VTPKKTFAKLGFRVQTVLGLLPKFEYVLGVQSPSVFSSNKFCDFFRQKKLGNIILLFLLSIRLIFPSFLGKLQTSYVTKKNHSSDIGGEVIANVLKNMVLEIN
jgi:hypothetical protein